MRSLSKRLFPLLITLPAVLCEDHYDVGWNEYDGEEICGVHGGRSALVDNTIYFMSSKMDFRRDDHESSESLYSIPLEKVQKIDGSLGKEILRQSSLPKDLRSNTKGGAFWYTNNSLYIAAEPGNIKSNSIWSYSIKDESWYPKNVEGDDVILGQRTHAVASSIPRFGVAFMSGGDGDKMLPIRFNASDPERLMWNIEAPPTSDRDAVASPGPQRKGGYSFWVPVGDKGILVYVGGLDITKLGPIVDGTYVDGPAPLSQVDVYDIETREWFNIQTNGTIPPNRRDFCGWVSPASDYSSYSITIYGGQNIDEDRADGGIYVLSVPSFQWIEIRDDAAKIRGHSCLQHGHSKGFVLGGRSTEEDCDVPQFQLLNLSTYTWESHFDLNEEVPYQIHKNISDVIGGGASGNASLIKPEHNWPPKLATIFASPIPEPSPPTQDPENPETTPHNDPPQSIPVAPDDASPEASSSPLNRNAIIGGVVGGSIFVVTGLVLVFLLARRRRKNWLKPSLKSSKHTSSTTINDYGKGFTPAPAMDYERGYQDPSPVHPAERPILQEQPLNAHFAGHQEPHPAPYAYREAHFQPPQADTCFATNTARDTQHSRPMSDVSSAMGTILICDGDSNEYSPERMDVSPVGSRRSRTGRGSRNAVQFGDQGNQGMRFI